MKTIEINDDVVLRELQITDAPDMFTTIDSQRDYLGEWLPFVPYTKEIADSQAFINSVVFAPEDQRELVFAIIADDEFAGTIGFKDTDKANRKTEIGYWLAYQFQGRGIVTSAVQKLCEYAFTETDINRVQIQCAVGNTKSSNIPKRLGFVLEGIIRDGELQANGKFSDIEVYSKLRREF